MTTTKLIFISFLLIIIANIGMAQDVRYTYDAAGNRIKREAIVIGNPNMREGGADSTRQFSDNTLSSMSINVSSNPTKGHVDVQIVFTNPEHTENTFQVMLVDNQGKTIINRQENNTNFKINLEGYATGIYYLSVITTTEISQWKIIKE